nr:unnamed protein product [Callosobruchus analis]
MIPIQLFHVTAAINYYYPHVET